MLQFNSLHKGKVFKLKKSPYFFSKMKYLVILLKKFRHLREIGSTPIVASPPPILPPKSSQADYLHDLPVCLSSI